MKWSAPALILGLLVVSYWARVLRMAYRAGRRTGKFANLVPREGLGRVLRIIWTPVIVIWMVQPVVTALVPKPPRAWRPLYENSWVIWVAVGLVFACFAATIICWKRMGRAWRMGIDPAEKNPLVASGPFAYVRHPIYALSQGMMLATALAIPSPLMLAAAVIHILLLQWESRREEQHLLRVQGEQYAQYCQKVGRFLPKRLRPYIGPAMEESH